jgi:hypothetical protein
MSPYMQNALEPQMREAARQSAIQGQQNQAQAVQQGAFGGSRSAIVEAERQRNLGQQQADIYGRGMQSAFEQARQAQQFGSELGLKGYGQGLQAAGQLGALGQQQYGQEMGLLGQQMEIGGKQQQYEQARLNQIIQDYATQQQYPFIQLGTLSNMLRGLPMQASTTQMYQAQPSLLQQGVGLAGAGANLYQAFGERKAKEGGAIKEMASGGIASGADPYKLPGMMKKLSDKQLGGKLDQKDTDPETMGIAQAEKQRRDQIRAGVTKMAGGGAVAFKEGGIKDTTKNPFADPEEKAVAKAPAPKASVTKAPAPKEPVSATPYQDQLRTAMTGFAPPADFEKARAGIKTLETRVAGGVEGELSRQDAAYKKLGIDPVTMFNEERARVQEEKKMSREDARKSEYLRYAQMFAKFGSTPGPVLRAAVLAINDTVPDLIEDQAKASAIQREANKVLSDLNKSELLEKQNRASDALKAHNDAAKTLTQLSLELGNTLYKGQIEKLQVYGRLAAEEVQGEYGIRRENIRGKFDVQAAAIRQAGSGGGSDLKENKEINRALEAFDKRNQPLILQLESQIVALPEGNKIRKGAEDRLKRIETERNELESRLSEQFKRGTVNPTGDKPRAESSSLPKPGQIVDGYKFIGKEGDNPNDKKNWAKE